jgi:DNA-binding NarL/FixJ family response regulator
MNIRVVLADDHPIVLDGMQQVLRLTPNMQVVAVCSNGEEALAAVRAHKPDVLVVDMNMPRKSGLAVMRQLRAEGDPTKVVLIGAVLNDHDVVEAIRLGVRGIVLKELASNLLAQCIRKVASGEQWLETRSAARVMEMLVRQESEITRAGLTPRQVEIVRCIGRGMRNKEVASRLKITEGTVKIHLRDIYRKLNISSRVELALYATSRGLTPPQNRTFPDTPKT